MLDMNKLIDERDPGLEFFITGTHAYGPASLNSDLDIVIMLKDSRKIMDFLVKHGIEYYRTPGQGQYGDTGGFYFNLGGIEVNIIIAEDEADFEEWRRRTEKMKKLAPIHDRGQRHRVFNETEAPPPTTTGLRSAKYFGRVLGSIPSPEDIPF